MQDRFVACCPPPSAWARAALPGVVEVDERAAVQ